jgi:hypothetical protein
VAGASSLEVTWILPSWLITRCHNRKAGSSITNTMKVYKARNGNYDKHGKALYVFVIAHDDNQAEKLAKEAFSHCPGTPGERGNRLRIHMIIEDVSQPVTSAVWSLPMDV